VNARSHDEYRDSIGPYVLGALPELEVELLERHLATCESCRTEVDDLRPVPGAIARSVPQIEPPPSLKASLMEIVNAEAAASQRSRRRSFADWLAGLRPRTAVAMAAAVLAIGVLVGVGVSQLGNGGSSSTMTIAAKIDRSRMPSGDASLALTGNRGTLELSNAPQPPSGRVYELWYQRGKTIERGGTFRPESDGTYRATLPVNGADAVMVTVERAGGVPAPTGPPVMQFST
jgi:anti-sigma-K factor RskA